MVKPYITTNNSYVYMVMELLVFHANTFYKHFTLVDNYVPKAGPWTSANFKNKKKKTRQAV